MCIFLRSIVGFLIQYGAGIALSLFPFEQEAFRKPYRRVIIGYCVMASVFALCFSIVNNVFASIMHLKNAAVIWNGYMLVAILVFGVSFFRTIQVENVKKLLVIVLTIFYEVVKFLLVNLFSPLMLKKESITEPYPPLILTLYVVVTLFLFPAAAMLMRKGVKPYLAEIEVRYIKREFRLVLAVTAVYIAMLILYASRSDVGISKFWLWVTPPLLLMIGTLYLFYWILFREALDRKRNSEYQKAAEIRQLQYQSITKEMEQVRRMRHDMKFHLGGLANLLSQGKNEEMKAYLDEVLGLVSERENRYYCQNAALNGILQYYTGIAKDENIRCHVQVNCNELDISPADLTVLFGNALENAICACRETKQERWIRVQAGIIGGLLVIQISNTCAEEAQMQNPDQTCGLYLPASAFKSRKEGGGYGLGSMEHTAKKYGGDAKFCYDGKEKIFTARIWLNATK